jgi:hypothetical protein
MRKTIQNVSEKFTGEIETIEKPIRSLGNKIFYQ